MDQPLWLVGAVLAAAFGLSATLALARELRLGRRKGRVVLVVPDADETRRSIAAFQAAARREELLDFVWRKLGPAALAARGGHPRHRG